VNGHHLVGAGLAWDQILPEVEGEAKKLLASGVAPERLYQTIISGGRHAPPPPKIGKQVFGADVEPAMKSGNHPRITVLEFCDAVNPLCKYQEEPLRRVLAKYGDFIVFEWWDVPRPDNATSMLVAATLRQTFQEKGHAAFFQVKDCIMEHVNIQAQSPAEIAPDLNVAALTHCGELVGLDPARLRLALEGSAQAANLARMIKLAGEAGVSAVPAFDIEGDLLLGPLSYRRLVRAVDHALAAHDARRR
jgi:protein-disulfide isomerase